MNRKFIIRLLALFAAFMFVIPTISNTAQSAPQVVQQTITVDITGNGDYVSIKEAIANANPLSIVKIKAGIYREYDFEINKKITLVGENPDDTIIDLNSETGFTLNDSYIEIYNLKIINAREYAIFISSDNNYCNISNCVIEKTQMHGIVIQGSHNVVSNCEIQAYNSNGQGVKIQGYYNAIKECSVQGFAEGIIILIRAHDNQILNCSTFNNNVGVDIRINSNNNIISGCNIYGNKYGVYLWQNSNSNSVYLNNFRKNDVAATDESNNTWDNGEQGNYWDQYTGIDANGNGIGDTPYKISQGNTDRYPLIAMTLPDVITAPANVELVTKTWDDLPSFTWTPSIYSKDINGYYVKIDTNPETFIGDITSWTSTVNFSNGVHIFYVRAIGADNASSKYSTIAFYIDTSLVDSDNDDLTDAEEIKLGSNVNDKSDVMKIYPGGKPYFFVDVNQDGSFDVLYNSATKTTTILEKKGVNYIIDQNGDGTWDYIYNTMDGSVSLYKEETPIYMWIILILIVIAILSVIVLYYIRNIRSKLKYPRYKEYKKSEMPVEVPTIKRPIPGVTTTDRRYTPEMIDEAKTLLKLIQQDVTVYLDKLQEIDEQIGGTYPEMEKDKIYQEPKKSEIKDMEDIESEVDKLLSELSKK